MIRYDIWKVSIYLFFTTLPTYVSSKNCSAFLGLTKSFQILTTSDIVPFENFNSWLRKNIKHMSFIWVIDLKSGNLHFDIDDEILEWHAPLTSPSKFADIFKSAGTHFSVFNFPRKYFWHFMHDIKNQRKSGELKSAIEAEAKNQIFLWHPFCV